MLPSAGTLRTPSSGEATACRGVSEEFTVEFMIVSQNQQRGGAATGPSRFQDRREPLRGPLAREVPTPLQIKADQAGIAGRGRLPQVPFQDLDGWLWGHLAGSFG
jgi:hypothetical protein